MSAGFTPAEMVEISWVVACMGAMIFLAGILYSLKYVHLSTFPTTDEQADYAYHSWVGLCIKWSGVVFLTFGLLMLGMAYWLRRRIRILSLRQASSPAAEPEKSS